MRNERRKRLIALAIYLAILLVAILLLGPLAEGASASMAGEADGPLSPAERAAIERVESGGDPKAHNRDEDARGILQIRPIYVADANRILGEERFVHDDAFDPAKAWEMFQVVTDHYIRAYGYADTFETRARIHNGGGKGPRRRSTLEYWRKVKEAKR